VRQSYGAERGFRVSGPAGTQEEPRQPQSSLDVAGIALHNPLEEIDSFSRVSGAGEILGAGAIDCGRLRTGGQEYREDERQHALLALHNSAIR